MRYGIISDLHLDHYPREDRHAILHKVNSSSVDHLLIAGDLGNGHGWEGFLKSLTLPYTWVRGNHDYYGQVLTSHYGINGDVAYGTLWSNFREDYMSKAIAQATVSDFFRIASPSDPTQTIYPDDQVQLFVQHVQWLRDNPKPVIMTHFPPSTKSIASKYIGEPTNPYFCNDFSDAEIQAFHAKLWVHGHVHSAFDYIVGNTRIICNPLGYPAENYLDVRDYQVVVVDI